MAKKLYYLVVDTETATIPFINELAKTPEEKKTIAIAKPLIYDIGWTICDRRGNIIKKAQYLIAETFSVPSIFNTAYYAEKRPIYLDMLQRGETAVQPWSAVMDEFVTDMNSVDAVGAFNAMFDFKKAIPFTELYIKQLYSPNYFKWEEEQKEICKRILMQQNKKNNTEFEPDIFRFRGKSYNLFDLWGLSVQHLLNTQKYKDKCIQHGMITQSGTYFKSSAESAYRYLCDKYDFIESHTALDDAMIETFILGKITHDHGIKNGIDFFPFQKLGYTYDYVASKKKPKKEECKAIHNAMENYIDNKKEKGELTQYAKGILKQMEKLTQLIEEIERRG